MKPILSTNTVNISFHKTQTNINIMLTCRATSLRHLTPSSNCGNTIEPYFLHGGIGLIFNVTSVTTPNVPVIVQIQTLLIGYGVALVYTRGYDAAFIYTSGNSVTIFASEKSVSLGQVLQRCCINVHIGLCKVQHLFKQYITVEFG